MIQHESTTLVYESFDSLAAALAYFDDSVRSLGDIAAGVTGDLELLFQLTVTSDDPGADFRTSLVLGNVPEPTTGLLLGAGLGGLGLLGRRRRAS